MSPRTRKRRRSQAFPDDSHSHHIDTTERADDDTETSANAKLEKEGEIWDAFREEHYEAIEQLPLTLHRQFILMRELDEQANSYNEDLLPTLHKYVALRRSIASQKQVGTPIESRDELSEVDPIFRNGPTTTAGPSTPSATMAPLNGTPARKLQPVSPTKLPGTPQPLKRTSVASVSLATPRTPTPMSAPPERSKPPLTTREMLSHMAWLSEEILRASEEKVNLAQAAYDSVDRHIRLVDQAIKEQETSISMGIRPGTHPAPIVLPDLVVPRWARPSRVAHSPEIDGYDVDGPDAEGAPTLGIVTNDDPDGPKVQPKGGKGKKGGRGKWPRKKEKQEELAPEDVPDTRRSGRTLRISGPALPEFAVHPPGMVIDPSEERFCYCNQVSFGTMIACDRDGCKRAWFHLKCAGLPEVPKGKWYCRDCRRK